MPPRIYILSDDPTFDPTLPSHLTSEGFETTYLPLLPPSNPSLTPLHHLADDLEVGETYAIIAFGAAASACLDFYSTPQPHICALIAYYPTSISSPLMKFPPNIHILTHLAASQTFAPAFPSHTYQAVEPGFAEPDLAEYDPIASSLAYTRTLGLLRQAFRIPPSATNLEEIWDDHLAQEFLHKDVDAALRSTAPDFALNHVPTLAGGVGREALARFYRDEFISCNPPSTSIRLVSRTVGVDRIVDEMIFSFEHTQPMPWMLPNVPPTGKKVSVALVAIVGIRGGKLWRENVYWDQASVLVQVGLLDPTLVVGGRGVGRLPVVGREGAEKVLGLGAVEGDGLVEGLGGDVRGEGEGMPARPERVVDGRRG